MKYVNNPYNIRSGSRWLGLSGNKNGFCEFQSLDYGIRAACVLLLQSYRKKGCCKLSSVVYRFAPPSENNTGEYLRYVAAFSELPVNQILTTSLQYARVLSAMAWFESNTRIHYSKILYLINLYNIKLFNP